MKSVWLLHHVHEFEDGHEDVKLIGVYTTQKLAQEAQNKVKGQPGFKEYPNGFELSECPLNQLDWPEGFITLQPGEE